MKRLLFKTGIGLQAAVLTGHLYILRGGLPIPQTTEDGRLLSRLMESFRMNLFGEWHTMDQVLAGYDYSWAALVAFTLLIGLFTLRRHLDSARGRHIAGLLALLWLVNAVVAFAYWGLPQRILITAIFIAFLLSWRLEWHPPKPKKLRIAIVGGGIAGLTAAWQLQKQGYGHTTVFEQADKVGGKCHTIRTDWDHAYDIGGHEMLAGYTAQVAMAEEVGAETRTSVPPLVYDRNQKKYLPFNKAAVQSGKYNLLQVGLASLKYLFIVGVRFHRFSHPSTGFGNMPPELAMPVAQWLEYRKLQPLQDILGFVIKAQGYGGYEDSPAVYLVKFQGFKNWASLLLANLGFTKKWPRVFVRGAQDFCERVAATLPDVRTNARISRIERTGDTTGGVKVYVEGQESPLAYDRLIMATPLDTPSTAFLDKSDDEKEVFSRVRITNVIMTLGRIQGLPSAVTAMLPLPAAYLKAGNCTGFIRDYKDEGIAFFLSLVDSGVSEERVFELIGESLSEMPPFEGVQPRLTGKVVQKRWRYFPHLSQEDLEKRVYDKMEALQGSNLTYFVGSTISLEIMGNCAAYAQRLVQDNF